MKLKEKLQRIVIQSIRYDIKYPAWKLIILETRYPYNYDLHKWISYEYDQSTN